MITSQNFKCSICGKEFYTRGNIFNQVIVDHYSKYKFFLHCIAKHRNTITAKGWVMIIAETLKWIPLIILQTIHLIFIPAMVIFEILLIWFFITHV